MKFHLEPIDWLLNPWRPHTSWPKPAPRKFKAEKAAKWAKNFENPQKAWTWDKSDLAAEAGPDEALVIWNALNGKPLAAPLEDFSRTRCNANQTRFASAGVLTLLARLYPMECLADWLQSCTVLNFYGAYDSTFRRAVLPFLTPEERAILGEATRKQARANPVPNDPALIVAGLVGTAVEYEKYLSARPYSSSTVHAAIFGLPPEAVHGHRARLVTCSHPDQFLGLVAHTGLDYLADVVAEMAKPKSYASRELAEALQATIRDAAAAPVLLPLLDAPRLSAPITDWFQSQGVAAADALSAHPWKTTGKKGRQQRDAALAMAETLRRRSTSPVMATVPFDFGIPPETKPPAWVDIAALPPIEMPDGARLDEASTSSLLALLAATAPLEEPRPITALKRTATPESLDSFSVELFETWRVQGLKPKDRWALASVALLGGPQAVSRVNQHIGSWAGGGRYDTARLANKCLLKTGLPEALWAVCEGALKGLSFASEAATNEAAARGVTTGELCESVMPAYGFDARGERQFPIGSRVLKLRIDTAASLDLRIYDEAGSVLEALPKPRRDDDARAYTQTVAAFRTLKLQIEQMTRREVTRLHEASRDRRTYPREHFEKYVLPHPVMGALARRLIWGAIDADGALIAVFRIDETGAFADLNHKPVPWPREAANLRLLDHLDLDAEQSAAWIAMLADYDIVQPFAQFGPTEPAAKPKDPAEKLTALYATLSNLAGSAQLPLGIQSAIANLSAMKPPFRLGTIPRPADNALFEETLRVRGYEKNGEFARKQFPHQTVAALRFQNHGPSSYIWTLRMEDTAGNILSTADPAIAAEIDSDLQTLGLV